MNINQIKQSIAVSTGREFPVLQMVRQMEADGTTPQPWLSHWDNDNRIRVVMHQEVFEQIKADTTLAVLAVKREDVPEAINPDKTVRAAYIRFVVITPRNIEGTF